MTNDVVNSETDKATVTVGSSVVIFIAGAAVGAITALLLAPQTGRESRKQLSEYGRRTGGTISEWANQAYALLASDHHTNGVLREPERGELNNGHETELTHRSHALAG
jgi:gas vesicle protein